MQPNKLLIISKLSVVCAAVVFAANVSYFFYLMDTGSNHKDPVNGRVVSLFDHGRAAFITHLQHSLWMGSLGFAAFSFLFGAALYKINTRKRKLNP